MISQLIQIQEGKVIAIDVFPQITIQEIKQSIEEKEGIPQKNQQISQQGKILDDTAFLSSYLIESTSILKINLRLLGGMQEDYKEMAEEQIDAAKKEPLAEKKEEEKKEEVKKEKELLKPETLETKLTSDFLISEIKAFIQKQKTISVPSSSEIKEITITDDDETIAAINQSGEILIVRKGEDKCIKFKA